MSIHYLQKKGMMTLLLSCFMVLFSNLLWSQDCCDDGDKPNALTMRYTGEDCSATNTSQDTDKYDCNQFNGGPNFDPSVYIVVAENEDGGGKIYFTGTVGLNETFTATSANANDDEFKSKTFFLVYSSQGGTLLQNVEIHTSCSAPLLTGEQVGSMLIENIEFKNGVSCGPPPPPEECPIPVITVSTTGGSNVITCAGDPVIFEAEALGDCINYSWNFGQGATPQTATGIGPHTVVYNVTGSASITLNIDNDCEGGTGSTICPGGGNEPTGFDCCDDGDKPDELTLIYTGEGCGATNTSQDTDKYDCNQFNGGPNFDPSVYIVVAENEDGSGKIYFTGAVGLNEAFTATSANANDDDFKSKTFFLVYSSQGGTLLQNVEIHTSCSAPLVVGEQVGSIKIDGIHFKNGNSCGSNTGGGSSSGSDCCDDGDKPNALTMRYTGEGCGATNTSQDTDKYDCNQFNGGPNFDPSVYIVVAENEDGSGKIYFTGTVGLNETFTATSANANDDDFKSKTFFLVYSSQGGTLLQNVEIHTSCSAPLVAGEQVGSMLIENIEFKNGVSCGPSTPPGPDCLDCQASVTVDIDVEDCTSDPCEEISIVPSNGKINVSGADAPIVTIQIFDAQFNTIFSCGGIGPACLSPQMIDLPSGNYCVSVKLYTAQWSPICEVFECVTVPGDPDCSLNLNVSNIVCDGNGTSTTTDDTYTFDVIVTGTGTSGAWIGTYDNPLLGTAFIANSAYGVPVTLGPFPAGQFTSSNTSPPITVFGGLDISLGVRDAEDDECLASTIVQSPGPCSQPPICDNVTYGGVVGFDPDCSGSYEICDPNGGNAPIIQNCDSPTGGTGDLEIIWLRNPVNCEPIAVTVADLLIDPSISPWEIVPGANSLSLDPGFVSTSTCYQRCTRRAGCEQYLGESNIVQIIVNANCGGGGDPDCADINISTGAGSLTVSGLGGAPFSQLQVFNSNWGTEFNCAGNCNATETLNLAPGTYYVYAKYFDSTWQPICQVEQTVTVSSSGGGGGTPIDNDGDGVPAGQDCDDNDPSIPAAVGSACDDGDANTTDDQIQSDGCTCEGTVSGGGGGGTGDCADINISTGTGSIIVSGLGGAPVTSLQVFNNTWTQELFNCFGNCNATETINLSSGTYNVIAKYYDSSWSQVCDVVMEVSVSSNLAIDEELNLEAVRHEEHAELMFVHNNGAAVAMYIFERSLDGVEFEEIAAYNSKGGSSNEFYLSYDFEPSYGDHHYRVRLNHMDGSVSYSNVKTLNFPDFLDLMLFPNPANQFVKANLEHLVGFEGVTITLYNTLGVAMKQFQIDEVTSRYFQMDIRDLHEGHYIVWFDIPGRRALAKQLIVGKR